MDKLLVDLWKDYLGPGFDDVWGALWFWKGLALVLLTAGVIAITCRRRLLALVAQEESVKHDVALFKKLDATADESFMDNLLNYRFYNGWCTQDEVNRVGDFRSELERIENQYLTKRMKQGAQALVQELRHLLKFTRGTFYRTEGDRVKFYPDRIEKERYDREWKQLQAHISITWDAYKQYRIAAKEALKV